MRVDEIIATKGEPTFSFEFFPPKTPTGEDKLRATLREMFADDAFRKNAAKSGLDLSMLQGKELATFHDEEVKTANEVVHRLGKL